MATQSQEIVQSNNLRKRIKRFYENLNGKKWEACLKMVDPKLRETDCVDRDKYFKSLSSFFQGFGPIAITSLQVSLHLHVTNINPKNKKFDDRAFAYGTIEFTDRYHGTHHVKERWIKGTDDRWYSRMVGLVVTGMAEASPSRRATRLNKHVGSDR